MDSKKTDIKKRTKTTRKRYFLKNIINTLQKTVHKFIEWVCIKFSITDEDAFVRKFEDENDINLDSEKQIEHEEEFEF